ncbi:hypothetical protein F2P81_015240 [Scophthalmus maximus]|uniref:Uncharacterized protein n=1 Tax=Scophthalmus maximus TaxID=52904 RepID=A0A6A4SM35_SCOMX|nr:hypothetical protein F2P81_015240 [Scophthalmus maximus]
MPPSRLIQIVRVLFQFGMMRKRERKKILMNQKLTSIRFSWTKINKSEKLHATPIKPASGASASQQHSRPLTGSHCAFLRCGSDVTDATRAQPTGPDGILLSPRSSRGHSEVWILKSPV